MRRSRTAWVGLVGLLTLLSACDGGRPEALLDDYAGRIARITQQPALNLPMPAGLAYPRHRERRLDVPEVRARLWDLSDYRRCDLSQLIAERNSIMGRYWPASQRLDYELRFAHRLGRCRQRLQEATADSDEEAQEWREEVETVFAAKQGTLAAVWWAVTYDSAEFERHFSLSTGLLPLGEAPPLEALGRLTALGRTLSEPTDGLDLAALEATLQALRDRYGGAWQRSALALTETLAATAAQLEAAERRRLCPQGKPTPEARIVETVFYRFYAERLQPYLAQIHQDGDAWLSAHAALLETLDRLETDPSSLQGYRERVLGRGTGSLWADLAAARDRHTRAWQSLLGDCGLMPSRPSAG